MGRRCFLGLGVRRPRFDRRRSRTVLQGAPADSGSPLASADDAHTRIERPDRLRYGLGVAIVRTPCGLAYGHTGNVLGYVLAVWNYRDARRQVVVLANAFPLGGDADQALRAVLQRAFCNGR